MTRLAGGFDVFSLFSRAFIVERRFRGALDALRVRKPWLVAQDGEIAKIGQFLQLTTMQKISKKGVPDQSFGFDCSKPDSNFFSKDMAPRRQKKNHKPDNGLPKPRQRNVISRKRLQTLLDKAENLRESNLQDSEKSGSLKLDLRSEKEMGAILLWVCLPSRSR